MPFLNDAWRACASLSLALATLCAATPAQTVAQQQQQPPVASPPVQERRDGASSTSLPSLPPQQTPPVVGVSSPNPTPTPAATPDRGARQESEDGDIERVETDLTNVLLSVVDKNRRFVTTLRQEDIRVLEDGVAQSVSIFQRETELPLSLVILIDTSASQEGVLKDEQEAARAFVDAVVRPGKDQAAVISFTGAIKIEQGLTSDRAQLHAGINRAKVLYTTNSPECDPENEFITEEQEALCRTGVWNAIWLTIDEMLSKTPENARRAIILLSDGDDTSESTRRILHTERQEAVDFALQHNTTVYSIGIRDDNFPYGKLDRDALRKMSDKTGGRAFFPLDREELGSAFRQIEQELRAQYLLAYSPSNKKRDGSFRQIKVEILNPELRKQKLRLLYRQGYRAKTVASSQ